MVVLEGMAIFVSRWPVQTVLPTYGDELLSLCWGQQIVVRFGVTPIYLSLSTCNRHSCNFLSNDSGLWRSHSLRRWQSVV